MCHSHTFTPSFPIQEPLCHQDQRLCSPTTQNLERTRGEKKKKVSFRSLQTMLWAGRGAGLCPRGVSITFWEYWGKRGCCLQGCWGLLVCVTGAGICSREGGDPVAKKGKNGVNSPGSFCSMSRLTSLLITR